jgi:hypothetical protein
MVKKQKTNTTHWKKLSACRKRNKLIILEVNENNLIGVGFGDASLTKDDQTIFRETSEMDLCDLMSTATAEQLASQDPDHDWRIHLVAPLSEEHYQRHGINNWVLYKHGIGFA